MFCLQDLSGECAPLFIESTKENENSIAEASSHVNFRYLNTPEKNRTFTELE